MCGVLAILGEDPGDAAVLRMRDTMRHRGPDGQGLWRGDGVVLAHRRLAVIDISEQGAQPMVSADGLGVIAYNGELYNDDELRTRPELAGIDFRSNCDTETLLELMCAHGCAATDLLRGMYAFVFVDQRTRRALVARDPFGIKPMYWARVGRSVVIASEIPAILAHPSFSVQPDRVTMSAYLSSARAELDDRTLFAGVSVVRPGEILEFDLDTPDSEPKRGRIARSGEPDIEVTPESLRETISQSVLAHLRTDVPICSLLSGGLDSTIIATVAAEAFPGLNTYCAGVHADEGDPIFARRVAENIGTSHHETFVDRAYFLEHWPRTVCEQGVPMCTPNEVAIRLIASRLRADGCVVTLTGEGADEFFAGYELPMRLAYEYITSGTGPPGRFQLESNAWIPPSAKPGILMPDFWADLDDDAELFAAYETMFQQSAEGVRDERAAHLRFHQRVNLTGLMRRLDSAMMLESVEARTPFADRVVGAAADAIPIENLYDPNIEPVALRTKRMLRTAFRDAVDSSVLCRKKASFPLPFQEWIVDASELLRESSFAREIFTPAAIHLVANQAGQLWNLAWPMMNLAIWGERWWGSRPDLTTGRTSALVLD
ncbi:MAG TPA: asparagine synthase (glutamine-hydrolyzing) [Phycisphaerales bacterium]|nr:asparagine synthase (glutamine-hydrolyzing) [Phycisphaerales bacterium]